MSTKTRFEEEEAKGNSEMAYCKETSVSQENYLLYEKEKTNDGYKHNKQVHGILNLTFRNKI